MSEQEKQIPRSQMPRYMRAGRMSRLTAVRQCADLYDLTTEERDRVRRAIK